MFERTRGDGARGPVRASSRSRRRLAIEGLEPRALMAVGLAPIPDVTSPAAIGIQVPVDGSVNGSPVETFSVISSNPTVKATIAQGQFLTLNIAHTSSGGTDTSFTGSMVFQVFEDLTPLTASRIEQLVTSGFYTGKNFHRISAGFPDSTHYIEQGGSVSGTGTDSPPAPGQPGGLPAVGYPFPDEFNPQLAFTGTYQLAMANAGPNTNSSQFFVTTGQPRSLDFHHTIFAQLVAGQDVVTRLTKVATAADGTTPLSPVLITTASLSTTAPYGVVHVDTTAAAQGQTSTLTVTATDAVTLATTTRSFNVNVGPTAAPPPDTYKNERAYVDSVPDLTVGLNQTAVFQVVAHNPEPTDTLTYTVKGGFDPATQAFTPVQHATATVDSKGLVTVVPTAGYTGPIPLLVGVRDQVNRGGATADAASNYQYHTLTMTVNPTAAQVNLQPIAFPTTATAVNNAPAPIVLTGNTANPGSGQTLSYAISTPPAHGTITGINQTNGTATYVATPGYTGPDNFAFTATDVGSPTPNLTSAPAVVTLAVTSGQTGAVRLVNRVLIVTPPAPLKNQVNNIGVTQAGGQIRVTVNGVLDATQPQVSALDQIIVYGTNRGTNIVVDPSVTLPTTLDGGHGGKNSIRAGQGGNRIHGWFGTNIVSGGSGTNEIVGRKGHLFVIKSAGTDRVYLSNIDPNHRPPTPNKYHIFKNHPTSPGAFYRFVGNRLVKTSEPSSTPLIQG